MSNSRKFTLPAIFILGFLAFAGFVYFNYSVAQQAILDTRPSPLSIELVSFPDQIKVGSRGTFIWHIDGSSDLSTTFTTIYWGYQSTPSALTKLDSPAAVAYPNSQTDYATGSFRLPETFDVNIFFSRPGLVWFRAYANIRGEHLWSVEKQITVEN